MDPLAVESWTWYALSWVIVIVRMVSRRLLRGSFFKLQVDDGLMLLVMVTDTVLIAGMNVISHTSSNLIDPSQPVDLTPENIREREFGSKMVLVVEQMQLCTIWLVKACLLIMYSRLTLSLKQHLSVKIVAGYVGVGFVVMEILYLGVWCRPFEQYWAVPPDNVQCSAATNHLITNAVLNITSDLLIIAIPMPIFLYSQLPLKRKAILCAIFAIGIFTILSAVLNKYYSFTEPFGSSWTFWYIRESSTAIISANLPFTWTLLQRMFKLRSFADKYSNQHTATTGGLSRFRTDYITQRSRPRGDDVDLEQWADSQEQINKNPGQRQRDDDDRSSASHNPQGKDQLSRADSGVGAAGLQLAGASLSPSPPSPPPKSTKGGAGGATPPLQIYEHREITITTEMAAGALPDARRFSVRTMGPNDAGRGDLSSMRVVTTCSGV